MNQKQLMITKLKISLLSPRRKSQRLHQLKLNRRRQTYHRAEHQFLILSLQELKELLVELRRKQVSQVAHKHRLINKKKIIRILKPHLRWIIPSLLLKLHKVEPRI